jgi:hypothetical protein
MKSRLLLFSWSVVMTACTLIGCGVYSFSGSSLPSHIRTVAVPIFDNETLEFELANQVTDAITDRFIKDGRLKVTGETRADAVIEGRITSYENKVHNYTAGDVPVDYIVVLRVAVLFRDAVKNREIWKDEKLVVSAVYLASGGSGDGLNDEESARTQAISELSEDVLARTMEQW